VTAGGRKTKTKRKTVQSRGKVRPARWGGEEMGQKMKRVPQTLIIGGAGERPRRVLMRSRLTTAVNKRR